MGGSAKLKTIARPFRGRASVLAVAGRAALGRFGLLRRFAVLGDVEAHAFGLVAHAQADEGADYFQQDPGHDSGPDDGGADPDELRVVLRAIAFVQSDRGA